MNFYYINRDNKEVNAKAFIQKMYGKYRFPTLLKMVDSQCRSLNIQELKYVLD